MTAQTCYEALPGRIFKRAFRVMNQQTLAEIAESCGQPWHRYPELVAANMDRPLTMKGAVPCLGHVIAIREGDMLRVPGKWMLSASGELAAPLGKIPTLLQDYQLDPISLAVLDLVQKGMTGFQGLGVGPQFSVDPKLQTMIANACVQWWRQDHPNDKPTAPAFLLYFQRAAAWAKLWGVQMAPIDATGFPWAQIDPPSIPDYADVLQLPIDWGAVKSWLDVHVTKKDPTPPAPTKVNWIALNAPGWDEQPYASWPWAKVPWASIPFALVPFSEMNLHTVRTAKGSQAMTKNLIAQLAQFYPYGAAHPNSPAVTPPPGSGDDQFTLPSLPTFPTLPTLPNFPVIPGLTPDPNNTPPANTAAPPPAPTSPWLVVLGLAAVGGLVLEGVKLLSESPR